jgi:hypothetical protein
MGAVAGFGQPDLGAERQADRADDSAEAELAEGMAAGNLVTHHVLPF